MNLLEKHRDNYKTLKKKELYDIIEEQLTINKNKIDSNVYNPMNSVQNNNRRALRKWYGKRHTSMIAVDRVKEKIRILRSIK